MGADTAGCAAGREIVPPRGLLSDEEVARLAERAGRWKNPHVETVHPSLWPDIRRTLEGLGAKFVAVTVTDADARPASVKIFSNHGLRGWLSPTPRSFLRQLTLWLRLRRPSEEVEHNLPALQAGGVEG
jgi:hypothetical protein